MGIIYIPSFYMRHTCCRFIEPNWSICASTAIRFEIFLRNERLVFQTLALIYFTKLVFSDTHPCQKRALITGFC